MSISNVASGSASSRLRRIEARMLSAQSDQGDSTATAIASTPLLLSCIRDYFAGIDVETIAAKMRRGGIEPEMIRYYTENIFAQAKAELTEWQEEMDAQLLAMPSSAPE